MSESPANGAIEHGGAGRAPVSPGRRDDFPDFEGVAYLNAAYQAPMPRVALAAVERGMRLKSMPHLLRDSDYFDLPDAYRAEAAALVGAEANDIAVTDSTIHAISCLTTGLDWRAGDEVLIPKGEFPSNRFPWLALAPRGVVVREVALSSAAAAAEELDAAASARTRVIAVGWVNYSTGRRLDLGAIGELARRRGALFVVDGTQGVGGLPFSLAETPCDLLACSGYKWLLGPYGLGFAWFSPELQRRLAVPRVNWFAIRGARDFNRLGSCALELEAGARRFDVNETADPFNVPAGTAALRYVRATGPATVAAHVAKLHERIVAGLPEGVRTVSERDPRYRSNLLCLGGSEPGFADRAHAELARRGVHVTLREGALRVSPHLYNGADDVDRLLEGLRALAGAGTSAVAAAGRRAGLPVGEPVEPASARIPERRPLVGGTIELRPLDPARDLDALFRAGHGDPAREELWTYMAYGPFESRAAMGAWLEECSATDDPLFLTVVERERGEPIGMVSFLNVVPSMRRLELGHIWYAPEWQLGRANAEAVALMLEAAFERWGYRRVEWKCDALNRRSRRAALRLGFAYEGLFRRHMIVKGRNRDTTWYSMTDDEWRRSREESRG